MPWEILYPMHNQIIVIIEKLEEVFKVMALSEEPIIKGE